MSASAFDSGRTQERDQQFAKILGAAVDLLTQPTQSTSQAVDDSANESFLGDVEDRSPAAAARSNKRKSEHHDPESSNRLRSTSSTTIRGDNDGGYPHRLWQSSRSHAGPPTHDMRPLPIRPERVDVESESLRPQVNQGDRRPGAARHNGDVVNDSNNDNDVTVVDDQDKHEHEPAPPGAKRLMYKGPRLTELSVRAIKTHYNAEVKRRELLKKAVVNDLKGWWREDRVDKEHSLSQGQKWLLAYAKVCWWEEMEKSTGADPTLPMQSIGSRPADNITLGHVPAARAAAQEVFFKRNGDLAGTGKTPSPTSVHHLSFPRSWAAQRDNEDSARLRSGKK